jgi:hypothetical protein
MHIVLAFLGSLITVLYLLNRLAEAGIDLGGLNPFLWRRRRAWRQMLEGDPVFTIEDPKEIATLLVVWVAKIDGEISSEEKSAIMAELQQGMSLTPRVAADLFGSSAFLLRDVSTLNAHLDRILNSSSSRFSEGQVESLLGMIERVAEIAGTTPVQREFIDAVRKRLLKSSVVPGPWGTIGSR